MVDYSEKIRALRIAKGLTQYQVAERIGMSKAMISAYETASKAPSIDVLIRLSRLYGVTVDYLVCVDAPPYIDASGLSDDETALITALIEKLRAKK